MSVPGLAATAGVGVPSVDQQVEPAWVRGGSKATQNDYRAALAFEQTLVEQLTKSLTATAGGEAGGEETSGGEPSAWEGSAGQAPLISSLMPQALAGGIMQAGGLGMAAEMTRAMQPPQSAAGAQAAAAADTSGGTPAGGAT